jgi:hypothetical protein
MSIGVTLVFSGRCSQWPMAVLLAFWQTCLRHSMSALRPFVEMVALPAIALVATKK